MTQPARQEPSMEEILASIRRIIAEDEPAKQSPPTEAISPEPLRAATPLPCRQRHRRRASRPHPRLTHRLCATRRSTRSWRNSGGCHDTRLQRAPATRRPNGPAPPIPALHLSGRRARSAIFFLPRQPPQSRPHSIRLRRRRTRAAAARSRSWSANSFGRCSRPGSMTVCRPLSSDWCAPKSNASRAHGTEHRALKPGMRVARATRPV